MTWVMSNLASFRLETVLVLVQDRCMVRAKHTIDSENHFGRTQQYHKVTSLKWKLVSVSLEVVLILMQDRCTVCAKRTIAQKSFWIHVTVLLGYEVQVKARFGTFRDSANNDAR